jgi:hypothetical protein
VNPGPSFIVPKGQRAEVMHRVRLGNAQGWHTQAMRPGGTQAMRLGSVLRPCTRVACSGNVPGQLTQAMHPGGALRQCSGVAHTQAMLQGGLHSGNALGWPRGSCNAPGRHAQAMRWGGALGQCTEVMHSGNAPGRCDQATCHGGTLRQ